MARRFNSPRKIMTKKDDNDVAKSFKDSTCGQAFLV